jgi:DNA-directed RNA polymerase II subunit RPB1
MCYCQDSGNEGKQQLTAAKVLQILKNIPDQDIRDMGLSEEYARPEWMMITVLPVPPPQVRPSIQMDGTSKGEDDLTHKLSDILKANANVKRCESEGAPVHVVNEFEQLLQFHIATYMDNDIAGQPQALQKSGRPVRSEIEKLRFFIFTYYDYSLNLFVLVLRVKKVVFVVTLWVSV